MKMLKKLALVTAVSMISAGAFAMEAMDDESMASATGQDGITIKIVPGEFLDAGNGGANLTAANSAIAAGYKRGVALQQLGYASGYKGLSIGEIRIHDDDGLGAFDNAGVGTANSGAIVIGGGADGANLAARQADSTFVFTNEAKSIQIDIDSVGDYNGTTAGVGAMLNVKITTPTLRIQTGAIYVANSNAAEDEYTANGVLLADADTNDIDGTAVSGKIKILDGMGLTMGNATINIQLGTEAQGAMIKLDTVITGGVTIDNFALIDGGGNAAPLIGQPVTTGGKIFMSQQKINDNGGSDLTVKVNVDVGSRNANGFTPGNRDAIVVDAVGALGVGLGITDNGTLNTFVSGGVASQDAAASAASGGNFATYAAAVAAGPAGAAVVAGVDKLFGLDSAITSNEAIIQDGFNGLVINLEQVGGTNGMDIAMNDLRLGDTNAKTMGDVQLLGLNINGTNVVIMGH